jgi:phosphoserine phosphatase
MRPKKGSPAQPSPNPEVNALVDLGGALVDPSEGFLFERFVRDMKLGIDTKRKVLLDRFEEWQRLNKLSADMDPSSRLEDVGVLFAEAMEGVGADELKEAAKEWVKAKGEGSLLPYSIDLIQAIRESEMNPVLISTSPVQLVQPFADYFSVSEAHGLNLAIGPDNRFTGSVENRVGMSLVKDQIAQKFKEEKRKMPFFIGNSSKDSPLIIRAIGDQGQAVLINPSLRTENEAKAWFSHYINAGQLHIIDQNTPPDEVVHIVRHALEAAIKSAR